MIANYTEEEGGDWEGLIDQGGNCFDIFNDISRFSNSSPQRRVRCVPLLMYIKGTAEIVCFDMAMAINASLATLN